MKATILVFLLAILFCQPNGAVAQSDTISYNVYDYIKVAPGMQADYIKLEKAWKKIHIAKKKAGKLDDWSMSNVVSPAGTNCEYNYVTRNSYLGSAQLANHYEGSFFPDNWQALLTPEELTLVNRTNEIRSLIKEEVWTSVDKVVNANSKKANIAVWNYFSSPAGKTRADHFKMERDIWEPVHTARVNDGSMMGWRMFQMEMPFGASMLYNISTVDLFTDMKQYLAPFFDDYFKKIHPTKDVNELIKQTQEAATLIKGEVRMIIDRLD